MKALFSIVAVTVLLFGQCGENEVFIGEDRFTLKEGEVYDAGSFKLRLSGIDDSRCPVNANCVWQGAAVTALTLWMESKGDLPQDTLKTCLGGCKQMGIPGDRPESIGFQVDGNQYEVILEEVSPYPDAKTKGDVPEKEASYLLRSFSE
ncbi:MAG TPA: hypothetical protein VIR29_12295 [Anseongella sp.]